MPSILHFGYLNIAIMQSPNLPEKILEISHRRSWQGKGSLCTKGWFQEKHVEQWKLASKVSWKEWWDVGRITHKLKNFNLCSCCNWVTLSIQICITCRNSIEIWVQLMSAVFVAAGWDHHSIQNTYREKNRGTPGICFPPIDYVDPMSNETNMQTSP